MDVHTTEEVHHETLHSYTGLLLSELVHVCPCDVFPVFQHYEPFHGRDENIDLVDGNIMDGPLWVIIFYCYVKSMALK